MKKGIEFCARSFNGFERLLEALSAIPVAVIVVVTFIDVFARYWFSAPLRGSMEIIEYAMALVIFTALPVITKKRQHVSVSLIDNLAKGNVRRVKIVFCDLLSAIALALLSWRLWLQALDDLKVGVKTEVLGLWNAPLTFALAILAGISTAVVLVLMLHSVRNKEVVA